MSSFFQSIVNPSLLNLKPYQAGKPISECQRELGLNKIVKLASNENPLGTSEAVSSTLQQAMLEISRYPDANGFELKRAISQHLGVNNTQILLGNGSEDVIKMLLQALVFTEGEIIISQYGFMAYKILATGMGIAVKEIPVQADFVTDLSAMIAAISDKTRMIILANPNNPTGTYMNKAEFATFLANIPKNVVLVCDEAYYEYMYAADYPQSITFLNDFPNLVITRTFSKAYGLAGLRLGYGIANEQLIEYVNRIRQPFNVNHLAQQAGIAAIQDQAFVKRSVKVNEQGKEQFYECFDELKLHYVPSFGNFILVDMGSAAQPYYQSLLQEGVIVRPLQAYQLENHLRFSIGTKEENEFCIQALKKIYKGLKS